MRILMVVPMPPQPQATGAIPLVLHAQVTGLAARHALTLLTIAGPDPCEWQAVDRLQAQGMDIHAVRRANPSGMARWRRGWRWTSRWLQGTWPWRTIWFWEPEMQHKLDCLLAQRTYDLVAVEDNAMGVYRYRTRVPIVFTEHEVRRPRPVDWHAGPPSNWLHWAFEEANWQRWGQYQCSLWRRFDRIQVFTSRDAQAITGLAPEVSERVRVNPFGIVLPSHADDSLEQEKHLLFVGNFTHAPNVDAALWLGHEIMPKLRAACPGVRLTLVGIYPPPSVRNLVCDDISVTGPVADIAPFFRQATVFIAPLRIGGGMRMKVLQAMALGKAVVTTPRGGSGLDVDGKTPPIVIAETTDEIVHATTVLLTNTETRHSLGNRARAFVAAHLSAEAYAERLEAVYAEVTRTG